MKKEQELIKEIEKLSKNKIWSVKVTTVDLETGDEYEVWNQVFYNEEDRENFIIKNKWEDKENEEKYSVERHYYENIGSEKINLLKAELKGVQETRKETLAEVEKMIDRCFLKENLLIDNIIQTGKTIIGTKADVKFMKDYKLELLELECEFAEELQKLKEKKE
jgi:hypothetical protein